jgi:phosphoglycerate-specific signal transduction histidine kinase
LGLSISIGLAKEQCQGDLYLGKANKNGAEFILSLPLDEATQNV